MNLLELESTPQLDNKTLKDKKKDQGIVTHEKQTYVHIKSSDRVRVPSNVLDTRIYNLPKDPIQISNGSNHIILNIPNNNLAIDDKIIIDNVVSTNVTQEFILTFVGTTLYIQAEPGTPGNKLINYIITHYRTNINIGINGVVGETSITKQLNGLYLFNIIPINIINQQHPVLYSTTINNLYNTIFINIDIPKVASTFSGTKTFQITLQTLGGIPLNQINSNFPIDSNHATGYKDVIDVNGDYVTIATNVYATDTLKGGGSRIIVANILTQINAYPTPDNYEITLIRNFRRVSEIKVTSSEIPFTTKTITPLNNTFFWSNLTEGTYVYSAIVADGYYNSKSLLDALITSINNISLTNVSGKKHFWTYKYINFTYQLFSNISTILYQPLETDAVVSTSAVLTKYMYINFDYHNLSDRDIITISGAISFSGIPASVINSTYSVLVVNKNQIKVTLPNYNTDTSSEGIANGGGNIVQIIVPNKCILLGNNFNMLSTLGLEATTNFAYSFTSISPIMSTLAPYIELRCILPNNNNDNYNYIDSEPILTKIQFKGNAGEYLYNRHTDTSLVFNPPQNDLSTIIFQFLYPNGKAVDFMNIDHSFTLLITELFDVHLDSILDTVKSS